METLELAITFVQFAVGFGLFLSTVFILLFQRF